MSGVVVSDMHGNVREANDEYLRIIGVSRDDFQRGLVRWDRITAPGHLILDRQAVQQALRTGRSDPYENVYVRPDGSRVKVLLVLSTISAEDNLFIVSVTDLSGLRRTEEGAQVALKASRTGIWDWNVLTGEMVWSDETREIFGWQPTDPDPSFDRFLSRIHADDRERVAAAVNLCLSGMGDFLAEYRVMLPEGRSRWVLDSGQAFRSHQGLAVHMSGAVVDISQQKATELKLRESEEALRRAIELREEFISVASHELRTPLTSIKLKAEFLNRLCSKKGLSAIDPKALESFLKLSLHQSRRLNRLINDLLDASRMMSRKLVVAPAHANLSRVIQVATDALQDQLNESGSALALDLDEALEGYFDPFRIEQVVENLLSNAIKYGKGAPILVSLKKIEGNVARLQVKDNGIGIVPELQEKIFERFERGTASICFAGLGLGLYIAREIIIAHHGRIRVESSPGEGTLFTAELPLSPA